MTRPSTFYFDIESGGFKARRNPLISVSFAERQRKVQSKFAVPTEGTYLSAWAEQVVVSQTLNKKRTSEKEVLMKFLNVLEGAPENSKLIGWNIGYTPYGQDIARGTGFDVPFLIDRAREYGLEKRYQKAFKRVKLHDEGATWAYRIAKSVEEKGSKMVQEGRLEETLFTEAVGYMKKARHLTHQQGLRGEREIVRALSKEDIRFAGWKQESIFKQLFGDTRTGRRLIQKAHESEADVKMLRMIRAAGKQFRLGKRQIDEGFLEIWGKETLENKIVSSVKYGGGRERYLELMQQAEEWGVKEGATTKLRQLSEASKVPWYAVESGHGILQGERLVREQIVSERAGKAGFRHLAGVLDEVIPFISRHRGKIGLAAGASAFILMNRGNVFSGKDDEYNVLEGLPHGGMAERMRHMFTDFGSGYRGPVSLIHVTSEDRLSSIREKGLLPSKTIQGLAGDAVYATTEKWYRSAGETARSRLGIPLRGVALQFDVDPTKVQAGWSEGGLFGEYKQQTLSDFLKRKDKPDIFEVSVPDKIAPGDIYVDEGLSPKQEDGNPLDLIKFGASGTMLFAGLTAKDTSFQERMHQVVGKKATPIVTRIPAAFWISEEIGNLIEDPSLNSLGRLGLGWAGWEAGMKGGMSLASKLVKGHKGIPGVVGHVLAPLTSSLLSNIIPGKDDAYNTIEALRHDGMAGDLRRENTDFGSPVNLAKAAMRAEKLYKGLIGGALKKQGIKGIKWESMVDEGSMTLTARDKAGKTLASIGREFEQGGVYLTNIDISKQLQGGIGKAVYEGEADIFRKIGYEAGETVTSSVGDPITARWQMQKYGSEFTSARQQSIFELTGMTGREYKESVIRKQVSKESFIGGELTGAIPSKGISQLTRTEQGAEAAYQNLVLDVLKKHKVDPSSVRFESQVLRADDMVAMEMKAFNPRGQEVVHLSREFREGGIDISWTKVNEALQGKGIGKQLSLAEHGTVKQLGYKPGKAELTLTAANPVTARWALQHGGRPTEAVGVDYIRSIMNKSITPEEIKGFNVTLPYRSKAGYAIQKMKTRMFGVDTKTIPSKVGSERSRSRNVIDTEWESPVNLTKAANKASKMFKSKPGGIASRQQSSIIEANNAKMNRKQKMQQFHRKAQVQQSSYSLRPGKRHRGQAGRLVN